MKTFILGLMLALTAVSGAIVTAQSAAATGDDSLEPTRQLVS